MKYSIIVPTYNAVTYIKDCIDSIILQDYTEYELIISDNHSTDGTSEYLESLTNENIKIIRPKVPLGLSAHWEFALSHAKGDWIIFVGSDDGLMPYFFELADFLIATADRKKIQVINSDRAYYFWEGCQDIYGDVSINYSAKANYAIKSSIWGIINILFGDKEFIDYPQMYTQSIVHKNLIKSIRIKQNGYFFSYMGQDFYTTATLLSSTKKFLQSSIPLGWVGSSNNSIGLQITRNTFKIVGENHRAEGNVYVPFKGPREDTVNSHKYYFYLAFLTCKKLGKKFLRKITSIKFFCKLIFYNIYKKIGNSQREKGYIESLLEIMRINKVDFTTIQFYHKIILKIIKKIIRKTNMLFLCKNSETTLELNVKYSEKPSTNLLDAWYQIKDIDTRTNFIKNLVEENKK